MTKAQLISILEKYNDDDHVFVEIHDAILSDDLYQFTVDDINLNDGKTEIRICVTPN